MRKIYTGIDIGSDSIKIVVSEVERDMFYVLAASSVKTNGVRRGIITDSDEVIKSLEKALNEIERQIGVRINRAIITVTSSNRKLKIVSGSIRLKEELTKITGRDINKVLEDATIGNVSDDEEIVTVIPISFSVDKKENLFDPRGEEGGILGVKAVLSTIPKKYLYPYFKIFKECGIEVVDTCFGSIGDYYLGATKEDDKKLGAVINIGEETMNISIFNKKIIIKNEIIKLGSANIDNDITYIYGVDNDKARYLKENFALASNRYADINDIIEVKINGNEMISINQEEITKVVEARVTELLKLAKKELNNLTNRKISYIIVTGGITELRGFNSVVENVLGIKANVINANIIGIRNNKFSSAAGIIKYFDKKMELRDKTYSMFDSDEIRTMMEYNGGIRLPLDSISTSNIDDSVIDN